jgi:hypothetical protein
MSTPNNTQVVAAIVLAAAAGAAMAWAGSDGGDRIGGVPVFALCGALAFAINWLVFVPSAQRVCLSHGRTLREGFGRRTAGCLAGGARRADDTPSAAGHRGIVAHGRDRVNRPGRRR